MPHVNNTYTAWAQPGQFNSLEGATSTEYNKLVNNISLMYARPFITVANTVSQSLSTATNVFLSGGAPTTISNSPASGAGSIAFNTSTGVLTVPVSGLYRVTMSMSVALNATAAYYYMIATFAGGTASNNHVFYTPRTPTNTAQITGATASFIIPMNATSGGTYPNSVSFTIGTSATVSVQGSALPIGANTTFAQLEYLGASTGAI